MAGAAQSGRGRADHVSRIRRGRGRGNGPAAVREAPDEAPARPVAEQDALAAQTHQSHVGNRLGAHRQGSHVRRGHRVLRDPVPRGRRPGDGRAQSAAGAVLKRAPRSRPERLCECTLSIGKAEKNFRGPFWICYIFSPICY